MEIISGRRVGGVKGKPTPEAHDLNIYKYTFAKPHVKRGIRGVWEFRLLPRIRPSALAPLGRRASDVAGYGVGMSKTLEQIRVILDTVGSRGMHGSELRGFVIARGWNQWQTSIVMARMVDQGWLGVVGRLKGRPGHTWQKMYVCTDAGRQWMEANADRLDGVEYSAVDVSREMERAKDNGGRWVVLPPGVLPRQIRTLADAGFEVARVIRWVDKGVDPVDKLPEVG